MSKNIKLFLNNRRLFLILCITGVLYTFPVYNKFWAPCDEGVIAVASQQLLAGQLPYKDFLILMYPPGQIYVLALLFKVFSFSPLIAGRVYTVFISVGISLLVFYMTYLLTRNLGTSLFSWLVVLLSLSPRLGAIPAPIWPGMFFGLGAIWAYMKYLGNLKDSRIFITGIVAGLSTLFRHDIGIFASVSILTALFMGLLCNRNRIREMLLFAAGVLLIVFPCVIYFMSKSATQDMIKSLALFPFVHRKTAGLPFPKPCFDLNMLFHGSLHFIKVNQYYIPIIAYSFILAHLLNNLRKRRLGDNENLMLFSLLLFGVLTFNQVMMRTDPAHLLTVIQPSVIFLGFMMHKALADKFNSKPCVFIKYFASAILIFLFLLLSIKNIDKYFKNTIRKVYKGDTIATKFDQDTIYLPKEEREEVLNTLNFIKKNTLPDERIYIGNIAHWKDDFGGSVIIYFLADRLPSTRYYEFVPGVMTDPLVQQEIMDSFLTHNVKLIVLQDIDLGTLSKKDVPADRLVLDNFIQRQFKFVKKFGKYNIYLKK